MKRVVVALFAIAQLAIGPSAAAPTKPAAGKSAPVTRAKAASQPQPTRATEAEIVADLIRYCAREALSALHPPPSVLPYSRETLIRTAHRIGNVMSREDVALTSSSKAFDDCAYKRRTALYRGAPLTPPLERLPPAPHTAQYGRIPSKR